MKKKMMCKLFAALLVAGMLTGCGGQSDAGSGDTGS